MEKSKRIGNFNTPLGSVESMVETPSNLTFETEQAKAIVSFYKEDIIRFRIFKKKKEQTDFSYAVIAEPQSPKIRAINTTDSVTIETNFLRLEVEKNPLRFRIYNTQGTLLSEDYPAFGTSWIGDEVTTYKTLQEGERFIGLGEKTGNLDRRGTAYTNWNTDKFAYAVDADPIYMSVPFYIGIHQGVCYGIFFDNTFKSRFNFGASNNRFSSFGAEDGEMNYYFISGKNVREIIANYTWLTGRMELPPIWSLGLQQCRYSYYPDKEVLNVARTFREKNIPADVIYLDIHYMDAYKAFSFDPQRFPNPKEFVKELEAMGFHVVVILDPGLKIEEDYLPYKEGIAQDCFVKYPDGTPYSGEVWPGWSHFPDFTKPTVRSWWGSLMKFYTDQGIDGFWNDMNEPAAWGQCLPDLIEFDYEGEGATHKRARNVYGTQMARSTYEGAINLLPNKRPFVLNRAGFAGAQRYAAHWTGDNVATDEHMLCGVRLVNSLGLSGIANAGFDVGGFAGDAGADLFVKWMVLGTFSPLFRFHSMINSKDTEPWAYGEEVEEIARNFVSFRYRLLLYIYSTFYESTLNGMPVSRSLAIDYTNNEKVYHPKYQNQYLFGDSILVAPVESGKEFVKVYLPEETWYDFYNGKPINAGEYIAEVRKERFPLFIKASAIIPLQSPVQNTTQQPTDTLQVHIYYGKKESSFCYYEDDGVTFNYSKGAYYRQLISFNPLLKQIEFSKVEGSFNSKFSNVGLVLHGFENLDSVTVNNASCKVAKQTVQFISPVSSFDPFYKSEVIDMAEENVAYIQFSWVNDEIKVQW